MTGSAGALPALLLSGRRVCRKMLDRSEAFECRRTLVQLAAVPGAGMGGAKFVTARPGAEMRLRVRFIMV